MWEDDFLHYLCSFIQQGRSVLWAVWQQLCLRADVAAYTYVASCTWCVVMSDSCS